MTDEEQILRYLLPDLLGQPNGATDKEGNMIISATDMPSDCYVFFIPIAEWDGFKKIKGIN